MHVFLFAFQRQQQNKRSFIYLVQSMCLEAGATVACAPAALEEAARIPQLRTEGATLCYYRPARKCLNVCLSRDNNKRTRNVPSGTDAPKLEVTLHYFESDSLFSVKLPSPVPLPLLLRLTQKSPARLFPPPLKRCW